MNIEQLVQDRFVIAGTGSRSFVSDDNPSIVKALYTQIDGSRDKHGDDLLIMSGAAQGWDAQIAFAALDLSVPYVLCIPNQGYGQYYWHDSLPAGVSMLPEWDTMCESALAIEYTMEDVHKQSGIYYREPWTHNRTHSNFMRNQRMVDLANAFLVFGAGSRGTKDCVERIKKAGKPYRVLG